MRLEFSMVFLGCLLASGVLAQVLPVDRATDWSKAGLQLEPPAPTVSVSILDFGGAADGLTPNNAALNAALAAVDGQMAVVYFPPGDYRFTSTVFLPDSVILRGATADSTTLIFDLGGAGAGIAVVGQEEAQAFPLSQTSERATSHLWTTSTAGLAPGDEIRLYRDDADLVTSAWALGTAGQIARITTVEPDGVDIASPLRAHYPLSGSPYFRKLRMRRFVGIECLRIVRADAAPPDEWSNIFFGRASHCWVRGVESDMCNFSHIEFFASTNCEVSGCRLHHAFAYGGSGQGYGVMAYYTSGENLVQDNVFEHLRHSMIVQAGANGNVFAYNRSVDPFWNQFPLPSNAAGEIVMHGDHPYFNLFEGNVVQNIVIDDSHGRNGPFNTLFRNRAMGWGVFMNGAPASDSVNFIGNHVTGSPGLYSLAGTGHFQYGNDVQGTVTPTGTGDLMDQSYYLAQFPQFLMPVGGWPLIGPNSVAPGTIPADLRFTQQEGAPVCPASSVSTSISFERIPEITIFPSPFDDRLFVDGIEAGVHVELVVRDALGKVALRTEWTGTGAPWIVEELNDLPPGIVFLEVMHGARRLVSVRSVKL